MNDLARERGVVAIVQSVFKNGPGITLSHAETRQLISTGIAQGIDTWDKFFEYSITLQNTAGITLNNRAKAAMDFNDTLDAAGKAGHFKGAAVNNAVRNLLQNITSAPESLANGVSGLDALASNLSGTGITSAVFGVGYITGGTVFAEANRDGLHSSGAWSAITD